jgi:hypothetical protein
MDYDTHFRGLAAEPAGAAPDSDEVEIICSDLRLNGRIVLGQFKRLSDIFNQSLGYVVVRTARLLLANGTPTDLELPEVMLRREDIVFVGQAETAVQGRAGGTSTSMSSFDRPVLSKVARRVIFYTPAGAITTNVHMFEEMTLSTFLDGQEPRFIPTTGARVRLVADRTVTGEYGLLLLNREQITAATEAALAGAAAD